MTRLVYCPGVCRECGCTAVEPCPDGCFWVEDDLCSRCGWVEVQSGSLEEDAFRELCQEALVPLASTSGDGSALTDLAPARSNPSRRQ
jgi:hypothetical protein